MRALYILLLFPVLATAQDKPPVYLQLIRQDTAGIQQPVGDPASLRLSPYRFTGTRSMYIRRIRVGDSTIHFERFHPNTLSLGGSYLVTAGIRRAGRQPALQSHYAQGSASGGSLRWQGAETGETFSYGPPVSSLEFDGQAYPFDGNGRLVPKGAGNGVAGRGYDNGLLRTGSTIGHRLTADGILHSPQRRIATFTFEAEQQAESLTIPHNSNRRNRYMATAMVYPGQWSVGAGFMYSGGWHSNPNRNGFLQQVYRQSLLAPPTFNLRHGGTTVNNAFGAGMDNPWFLLADNGQYARYNDRQANVNALGRMGKFTVQADHIYSSGEDDNAEMWKAAGNIFPGGKALYRHQRNRSWQFRSEAAFEVLHTYSPVGLQFQVNYAFNDDKTRIAYQGTDPATLYDYQRSVHQAAAGTHLQFNGYELSGTLDAGVEMYGSNTLAKRAPLLPFIKGSVKWEPGGVIFDASLSHRRSASELNISESLAAAGLLEFESYHSAAFTAGNEIHTFNGQSAIRKSEWIGKLNVDIENIVKLGITLIQLQTKNDAAAIPANGQLALRTLGDHTREGLDIEISYNRKVYDYQWKEKLITHHSLTFSTWQHLITKAYHGNNALAVAGFRDVYKIFAEGYAIDAIAGGYWLRDGAGRMVIGEDGFPLRGPGTRIIANAKPDFLLTLNNGLKYRNIRLEAVVEWQKDGDVWNGTAAALDYYGRSAQSGELREVTDYVFPGVTLSGHPNKQAVRFYDPSQPVEANRWVRYGAGGVAEDYIEDNSFLNLRKAIVSYDWFLNKKNNRKLTFSVIAEHIFLWQAYSGATPGLELYDQSRHSGLDYFRLPSNRQYGGSLHLQF